MQSTDPEILKVIGEITVQLTKIRQSDCKHLCVENFAPEIFEKLIAIVRIYRVGSEERLQERAASLGLYDCVQRQDDKPVPVCRVCGVSHHLIGGECPFMQKKANR